MILKLTNKDIENNIDVYDKVVMYLASDFPKFDRYTTDQNLTDILKKISSSTNVIFSELMPENLSISCPTQLKNGLKSWKVNIKFVVPALTEEHQQALEPFNGKQIFVVLQKHLHHKLYGTTKEPLTFKCDELDSTKRATLKGYSIQISGIITEQSRFISTETYSLIERTISQKLPVAL